MGWPRANSLLARRLRWLAMSLVAGMGVLSAQPGASRGPWPRVPGFAGSRTARDRRYWTELVTPDVAGWTVARIT